MNHKQFKKTAQQRNITLTEGNLKRPQASGYAKWSYLHSKHNDGRLIMFVHGTGNDRFFLMYEIFLTLLAEGYSIFTCDLDGHGEQSTTVFDDYSILSCFNDWYLFVQKSFAFNQLHIITHSLGGLLALHGVAVHGIPVTSLILLGVPENIQINSAQMLTEVFSPLHSSYSRYILKWSLTASLPAMGGFNRKRFPFRMRGPRGNFDYVSQVSKLSHRLGYKRNIMRINAPILALYGSRDRIAPPPPKATSVRKDKIEIHTINSNHFLLTLHKQTISFIMQWLRKF